MRIVIIGGGNMGLTYARAFINAHVVERQNLIILDKNNKEHLTKLQSYNIAEIRTDITCIQDADLIILAVKPQDTNKLFKDIQPFVKEEQIIISIMAGVTLNTIQKALKIPKIIRAMPNLPAQIGLGMTAFTATKSVSRLEQGVVQNLLATTGKTLNVQNENLIDAITAISGSGPAYVYYFMDALMQAGKELGLKTSEAELLVKQTFTGALSLFNQNGYSCQEWINKVSSKGGTTEAAIQHFDQKNLKQTIKDGTKTAFDRAIQLGK